MNSKADRKNRSGRGPRVLLVEDDPLLSLDLEAALLEAGAGTVDVCSTMDAAFASLERGRPDCVILDVHLADRHDGWALAELASLLGTRPPRIAFSTGSPQDIPEEIRLLGTVYAKPYDPAQLARTLLSPEKSGLMDRLRGAFG